MCVCVCVCVCEIKKENDARLLRWASEGNMIVKIFNKYMRLNYIVYTIDHYTRKTKVKYIFLNPIATPYFLNVW